MKMPLFSLALLFISSCRDNWPEIVARFEKVRWVSQDDGLNTFRDSIEDSGQLAGMIDFWEDTKAGLFLEYMREGLNEGVVRATGIPRDGLKRRRVPMPDLPALSRMSLTSLRLFAQPAPAIQPASLRSSAK
jgi:hypothetical protein